MSDDKFSQGKPLDFLSSRGLTAKREYVAGLESRNDPEALSLLVECLCDESSYLRGLAEDAFLRMADRGAPVLMPMLEQGLWFTRTSTARVLGRIGYRPAVPVLLRLAEDANATVSAAARDAVVAIGVQRGAIAVAQGVHRLPPDLMRRRLDELRERDRTLYERVERLMRSDELMAHEEDGLSDDHALVRASEEGVEWELLTGPPPTRNRPGEGGGHAGDPQP